MMLRYIVISSEVEKSRSAPIAPADSSCVSAAGGVRVVLPQLS